MSDTHTGLYGSHGLLDAELPLDRAPYEALATAVLVWQNPHLTPGGFEQIALHLTGHARAAPTSAGTPLPCRRTTAAAPSPKSSSAKPPDASPNRYRALHAAPRTAPGSYGPSTNGWTASQNPSRPPHSPRGSGPGSQCLHALQCDAAGPGQRRTPGTHSTRGPSDSVRLPPS